jgi:hypothetical protein
MKTVRIDLNILESSNFVGRAKERQTEPESLFIYKFAEKQRTFFIFFRLPRSGRGKMSDRRQLGRFPLAKGL